jgi:hypothetical protein
MVGLHGPCLIAHETPLAAGRRALSIRLKAFRQPRRLVFAGWIALRARHAGATALAGARAFPRLVGMVLANPAAVLAIQATHDSEDMGLVRKNANRGEEKPHCR